MKACCETSKLGIRAVHEPSVSGYADLKKGLIDQFTVTTTELFQAPIVQLFEFIPFQIADAFRQFSRKQFAIETDSGQHIFAEF
jgi:hypothetical protein